MLPNFLQTIVVAASLVAASDPLVVSLPYGGFRGFVAGNLTQFLGIPFAHSERFRGPTSPIPFRGVRDAIEYGPACPQQAMSNFGGGPIIPAFPSVLEDCKCLTLDIFKPQVMTSAHQLPVSVVCGFAVGNSRNDDLRPLVERSIQTHEPILVLTINYRVTAFGFLPGKEAAAAGVTNLGFRDQIAALRWVQRYIHAFGRGFAPSCPSYDSGGVSAGSMSTAYLTLQNKYNSNTLFRGALMQSGAAVHIQPQSAGQSDYDDLVRATQCTGAKDTLDCLRRVPFDSIMAAVNNTPTISSYRSVNLLWAPHIDGDVVARDAWTSINQGLYAKIPLISTMCDDEGTLFSLAAANISFLQDASPAELAQIARLYPDDPTQGSPFDTGTAKIIGPQWKRTSAFIGDMLISSPRRFLLEHASTRQNVWGSLNKMGKSNVPVGAYHTSDTAIWFTNTTGVYTLGMDSLVNFVKRLDPNGIAAHRTDIWPKWNVASSKERQSSLLTFSDMRVNITADDFRKEAIDFLNEFREKYDGRK
ncbi:carboxylic ester hydrolase [Favolaschia claudopus]|uniref:Carboxylic ester hydrolase n=1 Tax=Favolaschia claudopus TaxID=2862362 RepID=A0AAV9ZRS2_9AGAR